MVEVNSCDFLAKFMSCHFLALTRILRLSKYSITVSVAICSYLAPMLGFLEYETRAELSAKMRIASLAIWFGMLAVQTLYNTGENTDPCGTPVPKGVLSERHILTLTWNLLLFKNSTVSLQMERLMPWRRILYTSSSCHTLSNAFSRSLNRALSVVDLIGKWSCRPTLAFATQLSVQDQFLKHLCHRADWYDNDFTKKVFFSLF